MATAETSWAPPEISALHGSRHASTRRNPSPYAQLLDTSAMPSNAEDGAAASAYSPIVALVPPARADDPHPTISGSSTGKEFYILPDISGTEIYNNIDKLPPMPPPGHVYRWELAGFDPLSASPAHASCRAAPPQRVTRMCLASSSL